MSKEEKELDAVDVEKNNIEVAMGVKLTDEEIKNIERELDKEDIAMAKPNLSNRMRIRNLSRKLRRKQKYVKAAASRALKIRK